MDALFDFAAKCVDNKSVAARIGHSAKLHSIRSAVSSKGSAASKVGSLVGAGSRATVNCIPIPVIGGLFAAVEQKVEKVIKRQLHSWNLSKATTAGDRVKFTLKDLSVEELDRYRWKVSESIGEFNKLVPAFPANMAKARDSQATCDAYLDLALAAEQVNRRIKKLKEACLAVFAAIQITSAWIEECENGPGSGQGTMAGSGNSRLATGGINKAIADLKAMLTAAISAEKNTGDQLPTQEEKDQYIANYHGKCTKWCCFRAPGGVPDTWANCKNNAAFVLRHLADPFVPDSFNNNLGVLWKTDNN